MSEILGLVQIVTASAHKRIQRRPISEAKIFQSFRCACRITLPRCQHHTPARESKIGRRGRRCPRARLGSLGRSRAGAGVIRTGARGAVGGWARESALARGLRRQFSERKHHEVRAMVGAVPGTRDAADWRDDESAPATGCGSTAPADSAIRELVFHARQIVVGTPLRSAYRRRWRQRGMTRVRQRLSAPFVRVL